LTLAALIATAHGMWSGTTQGAGAGSVQIELWQVIMWSGTTQGAGAGSVQIELWQVINLLGVPMLALLFAQPVIDDLKAWINSARDTEK